MAKNRSAGQGGQGGSRLRSALEGLGEPARPPADAPLEVIPETERVRIEIGSHPPGEDATFANRQIKLFGPSNLDRAVFCRQLATLIEVGIPLLRALHMLAQRTPHPRLGKATRDVARRIEAGSSLSEALAAHESVYSPLVVNMIRVGESGGILEGSLLRLARIMESKAEINRRVFSALLYPAVAMVVAFAVVTLIMVKAVPVFSEVYRDVGQELPRPTQVVIAVSRAMTEGLPIWLPALVAIVVGLGLFGRTPPGRHARSWVSIHFPVLRGINRKIAVARFSRTLGGLVTAGVPLIESLGIASETNENLIVGRELAAVRDGVRKGERMTRRLERARVFPPLVVDMISTGEETGTLDRMLEKIADIYDADVDATLRGISTIIEPILIVLLGGVVVLIAMSVMLPYFNLVEVV